MTSRRYIFLRLTPFALLIKLGLFFFPLRPQQDHPCAVRPRVCRPTPPVASSDDEHLLSVSEVKEVATSLGHQDAHSTASKVVQEAMATAQVEEEKSISEIMEVMSDKTTLLRRNRSCPQSIQLLMTSVTSWIFLRTQVII